MEIKKYLETKKLTLATLTAIGAVALAGCETNEPRPETTEINQELPATVIEHDYDPPSQTIIPGKFPTITTHPEQFKLKLKQCSTESPDECVVEWKVVPKEVYDKYSDGSEVILTQKIAP